MFGRSDISAKKLLDSTVTGVEPSVSVDAAHEKLASVAQLDRVLHSDNYECHEWQACDALNLRALNGLRVCKLKLAGAVASGWCCFGL